MTDDDALSPEEREAYITRYGEYRRVPVVRYGPFRLDREWTRHFSHGEREIPVRDLVFEIDASSEFDMTGTSLELYRISGAHIPAVVIPSRSQAIHLVTRWLRIFRPHPGSGITSVACYRRRVGIGDDGETTPGEWYIPVLFRRIGNPMIDMEEATPLVEAALRELEQTETNAERIDSES